jgi:hypothetical protein
MSDFFKSIGEAVKFTNSSNQPEYSELSVHPPKYEDTFFKKMADDVKAPIEKQVASIESIAKSADELAADSKDIAESAKKCSDIALKKSKEADIKGWISIFIAALGVFIEFAIHHAQVIGFIKSILGV